MAKAQQSTSLEEHTAEELVEHVQVASDADKRRYLEELYRRFYPKVVTWCWRVTGDQERALDVAQEVFLRVHTRLHTFRGASRFSTWLYTVTRRVAINRMRMESIRTTASIDDERDLASQIPDRERSPEANATVRELGDRLRQAIENDLDPTEAQVLYLHFVDGLSLPAITDMLELKNKSGAKAYIVGGKRKLKRKFGRWLAAQHSGETR